MPEQVTADREPEHVGPAAPSVAPPAPGRTVPSKSAPAVVLIGPMGAGKSTVAAVLAQRTGLAVRDTDTDVETATGTSISDLFITGGEARFRELERAAVLAALAEHPGVLALGGGAVLDPEVRAALRGHRVVFLNLSMPVGVRRTGMATNRPLLTGVNPRATYKALLDARLPLYREVAVLEVDTDALSAVEVAGRINSEFGLGTR